VLKQAYPSGSNVDDDLVTLLLGPSKRPGSAEAFRGFINLFNDHLAPELLQTLTVPVHMIWGEADPWEPVKEAKHWEQKFDCIQSLLVIPDAGHCPHDESPKAVNECLMLIINQQAT
jgi:pimeloyl-ACP methyl ester carboxylesterase